MTQTTTPTESPRRVHRQRTKGWRLPPNTKCCTRPGPWGNPFESASEFAEAMECCSETKSVPKWMDQAKGERILWMIEHLDELKDWNLACFCPPEKRCHVDMLLIWANCEPT